MRHGQYDELALSRGGGALTKLGRKQATRTASALRKLEVHAIWSSTLVRAKETASIVAAKRQRSIRVKRTSLLCEVIPTTLPKHIKLHIKIDAAHVKGDRARADRAFDTLFRAAKQSNRTEIVVCHGNLIRYLVCRALGIAPKLWMRLDSTHCGLTEFRVLPRGAVRVVRYNDVGHLPQAIRTQGGETKK